MSETLDPHEVAATIHMELATWPLNCFAVATKMVEHNVVQGYARYGMWLGPISKKSVFKGRPLARHGWIEAVDPRWPVGTIVDPTRYVFEAKGRPYIWTGEDRLQWYDLGSERVNASLRGPFPGPQGTAEQHELLLTRSARAFLEERTGKLPKRLTWNQLHWIARLGPRTLGPHAREIYDALDAEDAKVLIPGDFWDKAHSPAHCQHCRAVVDPVESWCWGCHVYICETCSVNGSMTRGHRPEDHLTEDVDDG